MSARIQQLVCIRQHALALSAGATALPEALSAGWDWSLTRSADLHNAKLVEGELTDLAFYLGPLVAEMVNAADPDANADKKSVEEALREVLLWDVRASIAEFETRVADEAAAEATGDNRADERYQRSR